MGRETFVTRPGWPWSGAVCVTARVTAGRTLRHRSAARCYARTPCQFEGSLLTSDRLVSAYTVAAKGLCIASLASMRFFGLVASQNPMAGWKQSFRDQQSRILSAFTSIFSRLASVPICELRFSLRNCSSSVASRFFLNARRQIVRDDRAT